MKFFSNKTLIVGLVGALTVGSINLTSEQIATGEVKESSVETNGMSNVQQAGTPAVMLTFRMAQVAYRYYQWQTSTDLIQPEKPVEPPIHIAQAQEEEIKAEKLSKLDK